MAAQTVEAEPETGTRHGTGAGVEAGTETELMIAASVLLADAALAARQTGAELTAAASSWRVGLEAVRRPGWGSAPRSPPPAR
ncbi:hypothetical protein V2W30_35180 [Streptomyces sp. Q6]|uniref:Uncharacterized protein n=1 Tax=Streptomyces citrinus TaxID=3118173 RepID=A0ACD5AMC8_9ACTN